jgi:hypothetical protein
VNGGNLPGGEEIFRFDGGPYTYDEANADWGEIGYRVFQDAYKLAPWPQRYDGNTAEGRRLDALPVPEWLDETEISSSSRFGRLLLADVVSEYGGDPSDQPALNLLYLLAWEQPELARAAPRLRREVPRRGRQRPDRLTYGRAAPRGARSSRGTSWSPSRTTAPAPTG